MTTMIALLLTGVLFFVIQAVAFATGFCASWVMGGYIGAKIKHWNKNSPEWRLKFAALTWFTTGLAIMILGGLLCSGFWAPFTVFAGAGWLAAIVAVWWIYIAKHT
jgi:hypothetical protein